MQLNIEFHDSLYEYTNRKLMKANIGKLEELISFLQNSFPKLRKLINKMRSGLVKENLCLLDEKNNIIPLFFLQFPNKFKKLKSIKIVPLISGGGKSILPIIIGVVLIAASIWTGGASLAGLPALAGGGAAAGAAGAAGAAAGAVGAVAGGIGSIGALLSQAAFGLGLSLALSGVSSLLLGSPKSGNPEGADRVENNLYDSITNTLSTRTPIPINYGLIRVGGQIISAFLLTERIAANNGKPATTVKVSDYF